MSQELIYTSAPRGLKPGSRGFCTVASTQGIAINLAQRLESLSGYRHVYPPQDPNAHLNPVSNSHLHLTVGGRRYHVLSRICDIGLDYTQRTNKLAHHVVLNDKELVEGGPAWVLAQEGFMERRWDGEPRVLPVGRSPAPARVQPQVCRAWQQHTGDAGWGGLLAEKTLEKPQDPITLIFRPGEDMLPLFVETLALLPPPARWSVTFSTYYTKLPPGIHCQWRSVIDGSPEATAARRVRHQLVIDFTTTLPNAAGGRLVKAARSGVMPTAVAPQVTQSKSPRRSVPIARPVEPQGRTATASANVSAVTDELSSPAPARTGVAARDEVEVRLAPMADVHQQPTPSASLGAPPNLLVPSKRRLFWSIGLGIAAGLLLGVGGMALFIAIRPPMPEPAKEGLSGETASTEPIEVAATDDSSGKKTSKEDPQPKAPDGDEKQVAVKDESDTGETRTGEEIPDDRNSSEGVGVANVAGSGATVNDAIDQPTGQIAKSIDSDLPSTNENLASEMQDQAVPGIHDAIRDLPDAVAIQNYQPDRATSIGEIGVTDLDLIEFALIGVENIPTFTNSDFEGPSDSDDGNIAWRCTLDNSDLGVTIEVAELIVDTEGELRFRWLNNRAADSKMLVNCVLRISVDGQEEPKLISLRKPIHGKPLDLSLRSFRRSDSQDFTTTRSVSNMSPALGETLPLEFEVDPPKGPAGEWRYEYTSDKDAAEKSIVISHTSEMLALRFRIKQPKWSGKTEQAIILPLEYQSTIVRNEDRNVGRPRINWDKIDKPIYEVLQDFGKEKENLVVDIADKRETKKQTLDEIKYLERRILEHPKDGFEQDALLKDIEETQNRLGQLEKDIAAMVKRRKECDRIFKIMKEAGADSKQPQVPMIAIPYRIFATVGTDNDATKIVFVENKGEQD